MNTVWRVFAYLKRYPVLGISMLACAIASTLMIMVPPVVTRKIINEVIPGHHSELLLPLLLVAAVAFILQHGLNSLRLLINNTFEQKVIFDLRSDLYSHIQLLPLRWFDNRATGDLIRESWKTTSVERVLIDGVEQRTVAILQILIVLAGMFYLSAKLTLVVLVPVPFLAGGALCTATASALSQRRAASAMNSFNDNLSASAKSFRARARRTRSLQQSERCFTARDSGGDESVGDLQPLDVFVRVFGSSIGRCSWHAQYLGRRDEPGGPHCFSYTFRFSLRTGRQTASAKSTVAGWSGCGRARL
jgi:ABC-type bacteriocin/lantibiotic exporter with double-glycine peptidase domain